MDLIKLYKQSENKLWKEVANRPNANKGLWVISLLPILGVQIWLRFPLSQSYKVSILGIEASFLMNIAVLFSSRQLVIWSFGFMSVFATIYFHSLPVGILMLFTCFFFITLLRETMKYYWKSFTVGECSLLCQALAGFIASVGYNCFIHAGEHTIEDTTKILQVGLVAVFVFVIGLWKVPTLRDPGLFYPWFFCTSIMGFMTMLSIELKHNIFSWIIVFLTASTERVLLIVWFAILCIAAVSFVIYSQENTERSIAEVVEKKEAEPKTKSQIPLTVLRKVFHVLIVCVDVPGLLWDPELVYFSTGVILALFIIVEVVRLLQIPPFGPLIFASFKPLLDEKDSGMLVLTNIYLLLGCSAPMWLYPLPFEKQDYSAVLPMAAGVLTLGVGDTAAGLVGVYFGRNRWPGTKKTIEGTIACVVSQLVFVYTIQQFAPDFVNGYTWTKIATAASAAALVEAFTTQVDNLVLPLVFLIQILL
ncbi:hypothetical protein QYM36_017211 [Artemia franciscana]|uniref:dolichol kinase n=3 Tax=Artemia franciscana TaxID=6661 RepID=A0AA88L287_ARTSF|nr:hypothetical protein QYM36_017211 [Artemia franciscana]KAK2705090.1 hypothetical protein QYM36_017211 [Artemia franciscana]